MARVLQYIPVWRRHSMALYSACFYTIGLQCDSDGMGRNASAIFSRLRNGMELATPKDHGQGISFVRQKMNHRISEKENLENACSKTTKK